MEPHSAPAPIDPQSTTQPSANVAIVPSPVAAQQPPPPGATTLPDGPSTSRKVVSLHPTQQPPSPFLDPQQATSPATSAVPLLLVPEAGLIDVPVHAAAQQHDFSPAQTDVSDSESHHALHHVSDSELVVSPKSPVEEGWITKRKRKPYQKRFFGVSNMVTRSQDDLAQTHSND